MAAPIFLLERDAIIATALAGAAVSLLGSVLSGRKHAMPIARFAIRLGYVISGASILLFIAAGLASGR